LLLASILCSCKHEEYTEKYDNGQLHVYGIYKNEKMNGEWKFFYSDGSLQSIQIFKKGKLVSIDFWDQNGTQVIINGSGIAKSYFPSGHVESITSYKDNVLDGKCEIWYSDSVKASEVFYNKGEPTGIWKYWNLKGELVEIKDFN